MCVSGASKEVAGAVDEEDFIKAFTDVPTVQVRHTHLHVNEESVTEFPQNLVTNPPVAFITFTLWCLIKGLEVFDLKLKSICVSLCLHRSTPHGTWRIIWTRSVRFYLTINTTGTIEQVRWVQHAQFKHSCKQFCRSYTCWYDSCLALGHGHLVVWMQHCAKPCFQLLMPLFKNALFTVRHN